MRDFSADVDTIFDYWTEGEAANGSLELRSAQTFDNKTGEVAATLSPIAVRVIPLDLTEEELAVIKGPLNIEREGFLIEITAGVTKDNIPHATLTVADGVFEVLEAWVDAPNNVIRIHCRKLQ